jgi:hypothetical protein
MGKIRRQKHKTKPKNETELVPDEIENEEAVRLSL